MYEWVTKPSDTCCGDTRVDSIFCFLESKFDIIQAVHFISGGGGALSLVDCTEGVSSSTKGAFFPPIKAVTA